MVQVKLTLNNWAQIFQRSLCGQTQHMTTMAPSSYIQGAVMADFPRNTPVRRGGGK